MNRPGRIALLSMITITQGVTLIGGFAAGRQSSEAYTRLAQDYKQLYEETHPLIIDFGPSPNPFAMLFFPVLLGLILTVALLVGEVFDARASGAWRL